MIITVTLNPALDRIYILSKFSVGKEHLRDPQLTSAGGKGINVTRALKNLGIPSLATGFLGGPVGREVRARLRQERLSFDFTEIAQNTRITTTIIDRSTQRVTRIIEEGPCVERKDVLQFCKKFAQMLVSCEYVVFSGRGIRGAGIEIYRDLIALATRAHKRSVLDTSGKNLSSGLKAQPYLIKPNREEAEVILGWKFRRRSDFIKAVRWFLKSGAEKVVISLGAEGAIGSDGKEIWLAEPPSVKVSSPVGCGDALLAGFLYADGRKKPFCEALSWGVATGAANARNLIPGDLQKTDVSWIVKHVRLRLLE